jgi:hypothetical protein
VKIEDVALKVPVGPVAPVGPAGPVGPLGLVDQRFPSILLLPQDLAGPLLQVGLVDLRDLSQSISPKVDLISI